MKSCKNQQTGFSLLEVLVALVIFSISLLGFATAILEAFKANQMARFNTLAGLQLDNINERMAACALKKKSNVSCASQQIEAWKQENIQLLPDAHSQAIIQGDGYRFTIQWRDKTMSYPN